MLAFPFREHRIVVLVFWQQASYQWNSGRIFLAVRLNETESVLHSMKETISCHFYQKIYQASGIFKSLHFHIFVVS